MPLNKREKNHIETTYKNDYTLKITVMRNILLIHLVLLITSCENDNTDYQPANLTGNWVSAQKDTLTFISSSILVYKNYDPYFTVIYDCQQKKDSISLMLGHSSNLNDRKSYFFKYTTKQIELFKFNNVERAIYKRTY